MSSTQTKSGYDPQSPGEKPRWEELQSRIDDYVRSHELWPLREMNRKEKNDLVEHFNAILVVLEFPSEVKEVLSGVSKEVWKSPNIGEIQECWLHNACGDIFLLADDLD
jgi:predicted RNA-binding protein with PUA-like domain